MKGLVIGTTSFLKIPPDLPLPKGGVPLFGKALEKKGQGRFCDSCQVNFEILNNCNRINTTEEDLTMAFMDLRAFMTALEREGELHRIKAEVDWNLEMGAATRKSIELRGPALYFEKAKGYPAGYGVLGVPFGPTKPVIQGRVAIALGLPKTTPPLELIDVFRERTYHPIKPVLVDSGPCKEEILKGDDVDVLKFPVPKIHGMDGGRYVGTWDLVVTKDPDTGWVNWGKIGRAHV